MRVLLISANTEQINMPVLPLGMAYIAAAAERAGHTVKVVNLMHPDHVDRVLAPAFSMFSPDVIGITVRNIDDQDMEPPKFLLPPVKAVIAECRRRSGAPIVLGGPGYSIFPAQALRYLEADMGIQGEGEGAFLALLDRMAHGRSVEGVSGLWLPGGRAAAPPDRNLDLDAFPMPEPGVHLHLPADVEPDRLLVPFQTRRGCPMKCSYCSTPAIEGYRLRRRQPEIALANLQAFVDAGFGKFFFVDNTFNLPPGYAMAICDSIIKAGLDISWQAIIYPGRIEEPLVKRMAEAGCQGVSLGFESGNAGMLAAMNKRFGPGEVQRASGLFGRYGIERMGFLLLGGPGETRETVRESIAFAESLHIEMVKLTAGIRIYPDTPLAEIALKKRMITPETDLLYPTFYMEPGLDPWLEETVADLVVRKAGWVT